MYRPGLSPVALIDNELPPALPLIVLCLNVLWPRLTTTATLSAAESRNRISAVVRLQVRDRLAHSFAVLRLAFESVGAVTVSALDDAALALPWLSTTTSVTVTVPALA
jgi:hypothetical protein